MTKSGYETYILYLALQRHFSTNYDFFLYAGKVRASKDAYAKRNDVYSFEKLTKIIPAEDRVDFFVAHFKDNPKQWIKNMSKSGLEKYRALFKNLPNTFKTDLEYIKLIGPGKAIKCDRDIPLIHDKVMSKTITIESVIVLDMLHPFIERHKQECDVTFLWPDYLMSLEKYKPFVEKNISTSYNTYSDIAKEVLL